MKYYIDNEIPGRMRIKLAGPVPERDLGALEVVLEASPAITEFRVYPRIGSISLSYALEQSGRRRAIAYLCAIDEGMIAHAREGHSLSINSQTRGLLLDIATLVGSYALKRFLLPKPLAVFVGLWAFRQFTRSAAQALAVPKLTVPVLDAAAVAMSFAQGDPKTAGETMFLLNLGEMLEDYTKARSESALVDALMGTVEVAHRLYGDTEQLVRVSNLVKGDIVAVRTGMPVPVDGEVISGVAMVNQSSLTGEPLAVERAAGDTVFAGTSVEAGEIILRVSGEPGETRLRSIVSLVKNADQYRSPRQMRREELANKIVLWNFLLAGIVALAEADVGIAMGQGTAVAKEVADITLLDGDLHSLAKLRRLSVALSRRLDKTFNATLALNSLYLALGIAGVITPQVSSVLHNSSTIALSLASGRPLVLDEDETS